MILLQNERRGTGRGLQACRRAALVASLVVILLLGGCATPHDDSYQT